MKEGCGVTGQAPDPRSVTIVTVTLIAVTERNMVSHMSSKAKGHSPDSEIIDSTDMSLE